MNDRYHPAMMTFDLNLKAIGGDAHQDIGAF
jgi:hypothetical protein